jgi:hypothetical protein
VAQFFGPMIGSTLSNWGFKLVGVIVIGAMLRLIAGILIQTHAPNWFKRTFRLASETR